MGVSRAIGFPWQDRSGEGGCIADAIVRHCGLWPRTCCRGSLVAIAAQIDCERRPAIQLTLGSKRHCLKRVRTATKQLEVSAMGIIVFCGYHWVSATGASYSESATGQL